VRLPPTAGGRIVLLGVAVLLVAAAFVVRKAARRFPDPSYRTPTQDVYSPDLLPRVRRAAGMVPGDPPLWVSAHVLSVFDVDGSGLDEGAPHDTVQAVRAAYQIGFPRRWIMVDAGILYDADDAPVRSAYDSLQDALVGAQLIVFTHEHQDHVGGVVRSARRAELERNTLFTRTQLEWLGRQLPGSLIPVSPEEAARFVPFDYDPIAAVAPGVVLVKAPGHTTGSQIVFVSLRNGRELLFVGDVAWHFDQILELWYRPRLVTDVFLGEDREAVMGQLRKLHDLAVANPALHIVVSHDVAQRRKLLDEGVMGEGFVLP
jgi:glyoxylase-like metal-dependent hydrolase (beta-lactamase superfamily II)